ncbi:MAG: acyl-ACP desaturase [Capsulimonas sp.]|uniref:acyl-ACP desaturase n=1 Tax=Capsulimonas sp. TaxID=2494211 RepID=UPI00326511A0
MTVIPTLSNGSLRDALLPPDMLPDAPRDCPVTLLSSEERHRLIERAFSALYRWYVDRSQRLRNWNPDTSFAWRDMRTDHTEDVVQLIEGYFAVEQYAPDYTSEILRVVRRSNGRSNFQLRWGAEEERHGDTWENALLFSRGRTPAQIEHYKWQLRVNNWTLPWDDALHMLVYTVFQERATQVNYLKFAEIARGEGVLASGAPDPVLARACTTLAVDEAAHYAFFLEGARLFLYYFPEETLGAIHDVITHFAMPAQDIIPNWQVVSETIYRAGTYGPRIFQRDVIAPVLENLTVAGRKALDNGLKHARAIPDPNGNMRLTALWDTFDAGEAERNVLRLHDKITDFESSMGRAEIDPFPFQPNPEWPAKATPPTVE